MATAIGSLRLSSDRTSRGREEGLRIDTAISVGFWLRDAFALRDRTIDAAAMRTSNKAQDSSQPSGRMILQYLSSVLSSHGRDYQVSQGRCVT